LNGSLINELNILQRESKEKDEEIFLLKEEINNIKVEKSDSMYQVKSILKDFDLYSKYATNPTSRFNLTGAVTTAGKVVKNKKFNN
jgi:hypothetical protein